MKTPERLSYALDHYHPAKKWVIQTIERWSGKDEIVDIYESVPDHYAGEPDFFNGVLDKLNIRLDMDEAQLEKIPNEGPLVFIANHPYGLLDGLVLGKLASTFRKPWAILINDAMNQFDDFEDNMLPISFDDTREANRMNIRTKKRALKMLDEGGAVIVFPAGGVMTSEGVFGPITGIEWKLFTAKLIQQSKATVVPIYFHGRNSRKFHVLSQFSYVIRVSLYLHELMNKRDSVQRIEIGEMLYPEDCAHLTRKQDLIDYLRDVVYSLGGPDIVKTRTRKDYLDAGIGQPFKEIRQERRQMRKIKRREKLREIPY
ncbi:MAG: lysophospholipid acyltransferase family protein [Chloroflexota bacterium]